MSEVDFPAAHSMDTEWFAVDRHGRVAVFDTGEPGAMPNDALTIFGPDDSDDEANALFKAMMVERVAAKVAPGRSEYAPKLGRYIQWLLVFRTSQDASDFAAKGYGTVVKGHPDQVLTPEKMPEGAEAALAAQGLLTGSMRFDLYELQDELGMPFFRFDHDDESEGPGAYGRAIKPESPVTIDELPPALRSRVTKLDVDFEKDEQVHLADHFDDDECTSWSQEPLRGGEPELELPEPGATPWQAPSPSAVDLHGGPDPMRGLIFLAIGVGLGLLALWISSQK